MNLHLMEMLTNAEFHMSKKSKLNDPLDMAYTISLENYLNLYFGKYPSLRNDRKHIELVTSCFKWGIERGDDDWANSVDELQSKLRVVCFTEDGDNPLMWSHYAYNHTGVCLTFAPAKDPNFEEALRPVEYLDELIEVKSMSDFEKCFLVKLKAWSAKKEWRIVSEKSKFPFSQEALVEIVFGLRVTESTISWFKQFVENFYYMHASIHKLKVRSNKIVKVDEWDDEVDFNPKS